VSCIAEGEAWKTEGATEYSPGCKPTGKGVNPWENIKNKNIPAHSSECRNVMKTKKKRKEI